MLHFDLADHYQRGSSRIHRLDPRIKVIGAFLFILVATLLPFGAWPSYALLFVATLFIAQLSGLGAGYALKRSFIVLPFALAAITLPLTVPGETLAQWGALTVSVEGTVRFVSILVKSWVSVQIAILLAVTTAFPDLLWALRELRVPRPLVGIVAFMYRYLFVLADESLRLRRAREARSAAGTGRAGGSLLWRGKVAGGMVGNLAVRAFERSERIYNAMLARGFRGELLTLTPPAMTDSDRTMLVGWVTFLAMATLIGFVFAR
ncbi:MAG: cobalt ECF transporter T component CbiQ [Anaerolineales bacterium]|nr:cobalt ECF transporter T component CbiQ [Anaerolineales bacterium]